MKTLALLLIILVSCSPKAEKPKLSLSDYTKQAVISKGVIEKILAEKDYKKMHEIALAVESSRAVNCVSIGEECNVYGEILNKIVSSTNEGMPDEAANRAIYKKIAELDSAISAGQEMLAEQWKAYILEQNKERNQPSN